MRLLVVEDDARLASQLKRGFKAEGYAVDCAGTLDDGRWLAIENPYDAVVLDIGLPDGDGFSLCADLRRAGRTAPVLMLTARQSVADRVHGLDVGGDDYLVKPFSFSELNARIRALIRREVQGLGRSSRLERWSSIAPDDPCDWPASLCDCHCASSRSSSCSCAASTRS